MTRTSSPCMVPLQAATSLTKRLASANGLRVRATASLKWLRRHEMTVVGDAPSASRRRRDFSRRRGIRIEG